MFSSRLFVTAALVLSCFAGCKDTGDVPFPAGEGVFPPPISQPLKFSPEIKIKWQESPRPVRPSVTRFDLNKLPLVRFDSARFKPFPKKPDSLPLDLDQLQKTTFDYKTLRSTPLNYTISKLPPPKMISGVHPHLKAETADLVYEFGEPFLGNLVQSIFEDRDGFIWIGSGHSLYRYDGENLLQYDLGLGPYLIWSIVQDQAGKIWLGSGNGHLMVLDPSSGELRSIDLHGNPANAIFVQLVVDPQNRIWVAYEEQNFSPTLFPVFIIDQQEQRIKELPLLPGKARIGGITRDRDGRIWIATFGDGLDLIDPAIGTIRRLRKLNGLIGDSLAAIGQGDSGQVLVASGGAMTVVDPPHKTLRRFGRMQGLIEKAGFFISAVTPVKGKIWAATFFNDGRPGAAGIEIIDPTKGALATLDATGGLSGNLVLPLLVDRRGQVWIGTTTGLNRIGRADADLRRMGNANISTLAEDPHGLIWMGADSGLEIIDLSTGMARSLTRSTGLASNAIANIDMYRGNAFVETSGGLDIIDPILGSLWHYGKKEGLPFDSVGSALLDKESRIWISDAFVDPFGTGIYLLDPRTAKLLHLGKEQGLKEGFVNYCIEDGNGDIWFSSYTSGVGIIDPHNNTLRYLDNIPTLQDKGLKYLLPDSAGNMWIAGGSTIYRVNPSRDSILLFSSREGFDPRQIISLNEHEGNLYIGTQDDGVRIIHPPATAGANNWTVESFAKADGINKLVNTQRSDIVTNDGAFLWGDKGITVLRRSPADTAAAKILVTGIDLMNNPLFFANGLRHDAATDSLYPGQQHIEWDSVTGPYNTPINLQFPHDDNYLMFHFTGLNAGGSRKSAYRYFLRGFDKKWSAVGYDTRSKNYLDLPPGDYSFEVAGLFKGKWSQPTSFNFSILPPWWLTWWAYAVYALMVCAAIWIIARYRSRRLQKENIRLEAIVRQRTNELRESLHHLQATQSQLIQAEKMASLGELTAGIAHEIQNPLNFVNNFSELNSELIEEMKNELISGHDEEAITIANNIRENEQKINHHGKRADAIVKGMLQHSRTSTGQKEPTDLNALADEYLRLAYHGLRARDKSFNATMKTDFDPAVGPIRIVPQDIGRVILNLVTNAFYTVIEKKKDSAATYEPAVSITTRRLSDRIELEVKDNGNGIPQKAIEKIFQPFFTTKPAGQGTGLGLSLSYDIIKAHGGEITVDTREGEGTAFVVRLPATSS